MSDQRTGGFLGRWSRLKVDARQGKEPLATDAPAMSPAAPTSAAPPPALVPTPAPAPTLDDVTQLTPESDFSAFVGRSVSSDVKNAAMKKLFADPHFNVMDGLDVYIDDYSQPDPLSPAMLRQMASAKFLKLVDDEPTESQSTQATAPGSVAQSGPDALTDTPSSLASSDHDDTDLRLQPDPTAGRTDAGSEPV